MPQSNAARPPEPSSPPAAEPNALSEQLQAQEEPPASDSEAETERLHDSPVKKRTSTELTSPAGSARKRIRSVDAASEQEEQLDADHSATNGARAAAADAHTSNGGATKNEADTLLDKRQSIERDRISSPPAPGVDAAESIAAAVETGTPEKAEDDASLELENATAAEDATEAAEIEEDEAGDAEDDDDGDDGDEDDDGDEENEENDEERIQAISALTEIEIEFAEFRDKLHDQQIARFDLEIQMCTKGVHPELEQYHAQIRDEREKRLQRSRSLLAYQMRAILNHSHAGRCQVHQTHLKNRHTLRGDLLGRVTREWYRVNYERRAADRVVPEYGYVAQSRPHQIRRPTARSMGIQYHSSVPIPVAPPMICATEDERDEDLRQLGLR